MEMLYFRIFPHFPMDLYFLLLIGHGDFSQTSITKSEIHYANVCEFIQKSMEYAVLFYFTTNFDSVLI